MVQSLAVTTSYRSAYRAVLAAVIAVGCTEQPASNDEESFLKQRSKLMVRINELADVVSVVDNPDPLGPNAPVSKLSIDIAETAVNVKKAIGLLPHVAPERLGACAAETVKSALQLESMLGPISDIAATVMAVPAVPSAPPDDEHPRNAESYQVMGSIMTSYQQGHDRIVRSMCSLIDQTRACQKIASQLKAKAYVGEWVDPSILHPFTAECYLSVANPQTR